MSDKINDGGPAFPVNHLVTMHGEVVNVGASGGMTLRDWFAGQALAHRFTTRGPDDEDWENADQAATWAYRLADAMLATRNSTHT